jgi:hypothetical protein
MDISNNTEETFLTLEEFKSHLRITSGNEEDSYLSSILLVGIAWAEDETDCVFSETTTTETDKLFCGNRRRLHKRPVNEITEVTLDGDELDYNFIKSSRGFSYLNFDQIVSGELVIEYETGLTDQNQIAVAKQLSLICATELYLARSITVTGAVVNKLVPFSHLINYLRMETI